MEDFNKRLLASQATRQFGRASNLKSSYARINSAPLLLNYHTQESQFQHSMTKSVTQLQTLRPPQKQPAI